MQFHWNNALQFTDGQYRPDLTVYGSDMIWNRKSGLFPLDNFFFGANDFARRAIAYAPSGGAQVLSSKDYSPSMVAFFRRLSHIGVRDVPTKELVRDASGKSCELVLDPAFFLMKAMPEASTIPSGVARHQAHVTAYTHNPRVRWHLRSIAQARFVGYWPRRSALTSVGQQVRPPLSMLRDVAGSSLLVTSTFHGVVMALMTNTPFVCVADVSVRARLRGPISKLFCPERLMTESEFERQSRSSLMGFCDRSDMSVQLLESMVQDSFLWLRSAVLAE